MIVFTGMIIKGKGNTMESWVRLYVVFWLYVKIVMKLYNDCFIFKFEFSSFLCKQFITIDIWR